MEVELNQNSYLCVKRQILESVWWGRVTWAPETELRRIKKMQI